MHINPSEAQVPDVCSLIVDRSARVLLSSTGLNKSPEIPTGNRGEGKSDLEEASMSTYPFKRTRRTAFCEWAEVLKVF